MRTEAAEELGEVAVSLTSDRNNFIYLWNRASCAHHEGMSYWHMTRGRAVYTGHAAPAPVHPPQREAAGEEQQKETFTRA